MSTDNMHTVYSDSSLCVQHAVPFHEGYLPKVAALVLGRFLADNPLPYAGDTIRRVNGRGFIPTHCGNSLDYSDSIHALSCPAPTIGAPSVGIAFMDYEAMGRGLADPCQVLAERPKAYKGGLLPYRVGSAGRGSSAGAFDVADQVEHLVTVRKGSQDIKISSKLVGGRSQSGGGVRAKITKWSDKSRAACDTNLRNLPDGSIKNFLTLTYPLHEVGRFMTGEQVKYHFKKFRQWLAYHGVPDGFWFLEAQRTGNPHIHVFLGAVPIKVNAIAEYWSGLVSAEVEDLALREVVYGKMLAVHLGKVQNGRPCLEPMRKPHAASYYAGKYALKAEQKTFPAWFGDVGRYWGSFGSMCPVWEYVYFRGEEMANRCFEILNCWARDREFNPISRHQGDAPPSFYSRTMRGGVAEIDDYADSVGMFGLFSTVAVVPF